MFITLDILRAHNACDQGIKYIEHFYPNGAEMIDIIKDKCISKEFLHWGREHLSHSDEEFEAYLDACNIVNSDGLWYSQDVHDSKCIIRSRNISNSQFVFDSFDIENSADIIDSEDILNSHQIIRSSMIDNSQKIFMGINITDGLNICNSKMIARSKNIDNSTNVFDSSEIFSSENVSSSHFCQDCRKIKHCMFCLGLEDAEYHVFNRPVDKSHYELLERQYLKYMTGLLDFVRDWPEDSTSKYIVTPSKKFDDWYCSISDRFWKWARTMPNFDQILLYSITMIPEILLG